MRKKHIVLIFALLLIVALIGLSSCAGSDEDTGRNDGTGTSIDTGVEGDTGNGSGNTDDEQIDTDINTDKGDDSGNTDDKSEIPEVSKYKVTFDSNGGEAIEAQLVEKNQKIEEPQIPHREGYVFDAWYNESEKWIFADYVVTKNITLTAKWIPNSNTLSFNANSGSGEMNDMVVKTGDRVNLITNAFERVGYSFKGWSSTVNGDVEYQDGAYYTMGVNSTNVLYAIWEANENILVLNANNGTSLETNIPVRTNETLNLPQNTFVKAGCSFKGWSSTSDGEVEYTDGASYTMGTNSTYTLYAIWEISTNYLAFDSNGGIGTMQKLSLKSWEEGVLPTNIFRRSGYNFLGWSTTKDGEVEYTDGASYTMGANKNNTLYAVWEIIEYTLTYHTTELPVNQIMFTVEDLPLTLSTLKNKSDEIFDGWYRASDLSGEALFQITTIGDIDLYPGFVRGTDGLVFVENNGEWTVSKYNGTALDIVIPSKYRGKNVTTIGAEVFKGQNSITSIELPSTLKTISNGAFYSCHSITSMTIPNSVSSIGDQAFSFCKKLTSITIPDNVTVIGKHVFYGCQELVTISLPKNITSIGAYAFYNCYEMTSINVPNTVTSIGEYAFYNCYEVTSINVPNTVTSIGAYAFYNCYKVTSINIPNNITKIEDYTFYGCISLENVTIPNTVTYIGASSFRNCDGFTNISIPNSVTTIKDSAFYSCTNVTSITIPNSVTSIGDETFAFCEALITITIPNSITAIGEYMFYKCTDLESISIPNTIKSIGKAAFYNCTSLQAITIPSNVSSIGAGAFYNCTSLTTITIPSSVVTIGSEAFNGCTNLQIYCDVKSKPSGWSTNWNPSDCAVAWGSK